MKIAVQRLHGDGGASGSRHYASATDLVPHINSHAVYTHSHNVKYIQPLQVLSKYTIYTTPTSKCKHQLFPDEGGLRLDRLMYYGTV